MLLVTIDCCAETIVIGAVWRAEIKRYKNTEIFGFNMDYKQVILVRADLKLPKGKMAAQAAHAAVDAALNSDRKKVEEWRREGAKKVVLKVKDEKELLKYLQEAKDAGLKAVLITDAGKTVISPGTKTCVGIGPDSEEEIDKVTGKLKIV